MAYLNVDDQFGWHRKTVMAGNAAIGLWARAGSWSAGQHLDGFVPNEIGRAMGKQAEINALVRSGLWEEMDEGWLMHDYGDVNMTAAEWTELREKRAKAGSKGGSSPRRRPGLRGANAPPIA